VADAQMARVLGRLLAPMASFIRELSPSQLGAHASAAISRRERPPIDECGSPHTVARGIQSSLGGGGASTLGRLMRSYSDGLRWLRACLGGDALRTLLQRTWMETLALLVQALGQHAFVPQSLGEAFANDVGALLDAFAHVLQCDGHGPTKEWLRRRGAPLRATLELCQLGTPALLQQYRIQPAGPRRTAPLVALAMRMDDREAAEHVCTRDP
jgi:hypothetical protein